MEPPYKPWQPLRGVLTLIVILAMGFITFSVFTPLEWIIHVSEFNMLLAINLVFLIFFLHGYHKGWMERMYAPIYSIGWIGRRLAPYHRGARALIQTAFAAILITATYPILRFTIGPSFPWMLFFEIQALFVFLHIALMFGNWPLHRIRQPYQGIGLFAIAYGVSVLLYLGFHDFSTFYAGAQAVPPEVLTVLLPQSPGPWLEAINPHGMAEAFYMATINTMFILYLCVFYFLFDMWPFRLLKKQPWIGITASIAVVLLSLVTWQLALAVYPQIITVDMGLLTGGQAAGFAPLSVLPLEAQYNISMLFVLGAFEGPLIFGVLTMSAIFMWWPTTAFCRGGRAPFNRQPWKGLILISLVAVVAFFAYLGLSGFAYMLMPESSWMVPGMIPPPYLTLLWLVICFLPGLSAYTVYYVGAWEAYPQPPLPPPYPDFLLYKTVKVPTALSEKRKGEIKGRLVR